MKRIKYILSIFFIVTAFLSIFLWLFIKKSNDKKFENPVSTTTNVLELEYETDLDLKPAVNVKLHPSDRLDSDSDGIFDDSEKALGKNPQVADFDISGPDRDKDGLSDKEESFFGMDVDNPDSDGDGLSDGAEIDTFTAGSLLDSDGDGLSDEDELNIHFTNPYSLDSDGDGHSDGEEVKSGHNPRK